MRVAKGVLLEEDPGRTKLICLAAACRIVNLCLFSWLAVAVFGILAPLFVLVALVAS
jgi:type IV secretory pathway VirB6-like protein